MTLSERNDPETAYSDPPGKRALAKGSIAYAVGILIGVLALFLASLSLLPALGLLIIAIPLGIWGKKKLQHNERQIRTQS